MNWTVEHGDNRAALAGMDADSIDAVVTDPPYELGFMGKRWDSTGIAYDVGFWREVHRVLKPGAHLIAFGGTRTYHRMACAIEDAGFEVRDSLHWVYTQGFPKSLDISKAIDKAAGMEREVIGTKLGMPGYSLATSKGQNIYSGGIGGTGDPERECEITAPATEAARQWSGWGTALKPAHEPIVLARKPLAGTVAANVLRWGTGAVNIDRCRLEMSAEDQETIRNMGGFGKEGWKNTTSPAFNTNNSKNPMVRTQVEPHTLGRWPPNFILSHSPDCGAACIPGCAVDELERQSASSRMFPCFRYEPKPSRAEREAGCEALSTKPGAEAIGRDEGSAGTQSPRAGAGRVAPQIANVHPTVKSIELMRWLVRLVTPPGGLILDPFCGSGTTGCAAVLEGMKFIGIEREREYVDIAEARIDHWIRQGGQVATGDDVTGPVQLGLFGGDKS